MGNCSSTSNQAHNEKAKSREEIKSVAKEFRSTDNIVCKFDLDGHLNFI